MGQDITVAQAPSISNTTHIFELNRSLTGMEIETFSDIESTAKGHSAPEILARRILTLGATSVSVYSNIVTVECSPEIFSNIEPKIIDVMENLFRYYGDRAGWSDSAR
jgi:hypothetical protein